MPSHDAIVSVENVTKVYQQGKVEVHALRGLSLEVGAGELTALYGPSGSGKTTLLNIVGALDRPTSGLVRLEGKDLGGMSRRSLSHLRRDRIGFVFQAYNLIPVLTAYENAETVMALQGIEPAARRKKIGELFQEMGLDGLEDRRPDELSGGQQQRVAIARALAMRPKVMLFDEVTSALDPEVVGEVTHVIRKLATEHSLTMIMVTHQMGFAREISSRVCFFYEGRIAEEGDPDKLFTDPQNPRTQQFLNAVLQAD